MSYTNPLGLAPADRQDLETALDYLGRALDCNWDRKITEDYVGHWLDEASVRLETRKAERTVKYALRDSGTSEFVSKLPHDFEVENFVSGWTNSGMLTWDSEEEAEKARATDPDGASLVVEEVEL